MSGGAAAPDADMMVRGGGRDERVAASPQSNGSKNFTNKMQVPRIDLGALTGGMQQGRADEQPGLNEGRKPAERDKRKRAR